ncbi:Protein phosphatase [Planoprotostelium fungivorum]|uniref:protein-tyrosine-phosphatase n=1 Tax=Planoprotostelium fungivorum TaxID=1890364 RepID=A0A2P6NF97_9EUKA|nr:Protein phosphatase [Planoprotostelium fungivorum]
MRRTRSSAQRETESNRILYVGDSSSPAVSRQNQGLRDVTNQLQKRFVEIESFTLRSFRITEKKALPSSTVGPSHKSPPRKKIMAIKSSKDSKRKELPLVIRSLWQDPTPQPREESKIIVKQEPDVIRQEDIQDILAEKEEKKQTVEPLREEPIYSRGLGILVEHSLHLGNKNDAIPSNLLWLKAKNIKHIIRIDDRKTTTTLQKKLEDNEFVDAKHVRNVITSAVRLIEDCTSNGQPTLVHCIAGCSRSASVIVAYLSRKHKLTPTESLFMLRAIIHHQDIDHVLRPRALFLELDTLWYCSTQMSKCVRRPEGKT